MCLQPRQLVAEAARDRRRLRTIRIFRVGKPVARIEIKELQQLLVHAGYHVGKVDGVLGGEHDPTPVPLAHRLLADRELLARRRRQYGLRQRRRQNAGPRQQG